VYKSGGGRGREFSEMRVCFVGRGGERLHCGNVRWFVGDWCGGGSDGWCCFRCFVCSICNR
jgi:hypothetical protein